MNRLRGAVTAPDVHPTSWEAPVFLGGTGRSGTWALGRLLAVPPTWRTVRTELRFHASQGGMADLLRGRISDESFLRNLQRRWYRRDGGSGQPKGLQIVVEEPEYRAAVRRYKRARKAGMTAEMACRQLYLDVLHGYLTDAGASHWAETTPDNAAAADVLALVFPQARFVHTVRDGRDVAASVATMPWGPEDLDGGLDWWDRRLRLADAGMRACPPGTAHTVVLEDLLVDRPEQVLDDTLRFLGLRGPDDAEVRDAFWRRMTASEAHIGRWRETLDGDEARRFDRRYRELYAALVEDDIVALPLEPDRVDAMGG